MPDPSNLYKHLPDAWDRNIASDQYKLMSSLEAGFTSYRAELQAWINERAISTATGDGLERAVTNYGLFRPPGMGDAQLRTLAIAIVKARRCTLAAIKEVFEAATGIFVDVNDKQTDGTIPSWEIQISPASGSVWPSFKRGVYPSIGLTEIFFAKPLRSAVAGPLLNQLGLEGGFANDHVWYPVSIWTMILLDKIRPAGTYYRFLGI